MSAEATLRPELTIETPRTGELVGPRRRSRLLIVVGLALLVRFLDTNVPTWFPDVAFVKSIEFPVYAIVVGLIGGAVLQALGVRDQLNAAFRTEFFIKTGLVLLGASINLALIAQAAGPAIVQSIVLITHRLPRDLVPGRAPWGSTTSCARSWRPACRSAASRAAIAAAGAVAAKKEQLAYVASLVIAFALPSIFIQPWLAQQLGLSQAVAGAWIGGNIDTTAAVTAAGSIVGDDALKIAAIVKSTQNAMMGVVAFLLTVWFVYRVERQPGATVSLSVLWTRFPKFILGFVAASAIATWFINGSGVAKASDIARSPGPICGRSSSSWRSSASGSNSGCRRCARRASSRSWSSAQHRS